ncbi:MAG: tRNA 2-thiocytidine biosynthesis protein TtcA [Zoogloeaceae bacterium]|nr:tRNA 2-thiocytidine biosynthesis protein TtcA [Gammaproteobacteria bacterium]MCP5230804.1 tRNA 2-thiocytidine biosynthesis protein TtcA [Zoogloeaceae bacterium]
MNDAAKIDQAPPKALLRPVGRALVDYRMINDGDRVLLALSGGKDSLSLLHLLRHFQRHAPVRFELGAVTIDPGAEDFDPSPLKPYLAELGIPYFYREEPILERAKTQMGKPSYCAFCARMKRGALYSCARENGYNVLALGQHLDDLAESFLMSAMFEGRLNTMKANYVIRAGDLRVIRPLIYVRERQTASYAAHAGLPVIYETCPACFAHPTQRAEMKTLLAQQERSHPQIFKTLLHTMRPLMARGAGDGEDVAD